MRLASLAQGGRDGTLIFVSGDARGYISADSIALTLQQALDDWDATEPRLHALADRLERGEGTDLSAAMLAAPLPGARQWLDGSLIGSGTVANRDTERRGSAYIAKRRAHESITQGAPRTDYLRFGQRVRMAAADASGHSPFGVIDQQVVAAPLSTGEGRG